LKKGRIADVCVSALQHLLYSSLGNDLRIHIALQARLTSLHRGSSGFRRLDFEPGGPRDAMYTAAHFNDGECSRRLILDA
jgi:hypothetical protein